MSAVLPEFIRNFKRLPRRGGTTPPSPAGAETPVNRTLAGEKVENFGAGQRIAAGPVPGSAPPPQQQPANGGAPLLVAEAEAVRPRRAQPPPMDDAGQMGARSAAEFDPHQAATRPRITDPVGRLEKQIAYEQSNPAEDTDGRAKTGLKEAVRGFLDGFISDGLPGGIRGAAVRGIYGAVKPSVNEKRGQQQRVSGWQQQLADARGAEKSRLDREEQQADIQVKNANRDWLKRRPDIEEGKRQSAAQKSEQQLVLSMLRLRKRPFDMSNPHDAAQIERAERAGVSADWDSFGLDTKNPYSVEVIDPEDPSGTKKTRMVYDRQSREWKPLGYQTNYVQPVNTETGMTPAQMDASADRKSGLQIRREALELSTAEYRRRLEAGLSTEAGRAFNIETKGQFEALRAIRSDIEDLKTRKSKKEIMPADAERRITELEQEAARLGDGIEEAREKALAGMGSGGARTRAGAPAGSSSSPVKGRVSRAKFRAQNPRYKDASDAEIDSLLGARGLQGY